jgi:hypothetical protein
MDQENEAEDNKACDCSCHEMHGPMKMEFKLAMLEKKEKILQIKLEFIGKMKEMLKKMPVDKK